MHRNLLIIILLGFFFRNLIAFLNFFFPTLGGAHDAYRFDTCAAYFAGYNTIDKWKDICEYFYSTNFFEGIMYTAEFRLGYEVGYNGYKRITNYLNKGD